MLNRIFNAILSKPSWAVKTNIGLKRENNEDSYVIEAESQDNCKVSQLGRLFVVADGMGGHSAGETASRMACQGMLGYFDYSGVLDLEKQRQHLESVVLETHRKIFEKAAATPDLRGMGTTLSALVLTKGHAIIAHVGDSRIYRLRNGELVQLTKDHTKVQQFIEMGRLTPEEAATHHLRHILRLAVGAMEHLGEVFTRIEKTSKGDVFLVCSDGLHDLLRDDEIKYILTNNPLPKAACDRLVAAALDKGGQDNVTVVVVKE